MFAPRKKEREKVQLTKTAWKQAFRIFGYLKPYRLTFALGLFILILGSLLSMLFPALTGQLVDVGTRTPDTETLFNLQNVDQIALLLFGVFAAQAVLSFLRVYLFNDVTERVLMQLRQDTYSHMIRLPMTFFDKKRVGELNSRISADITQIQETFTIVFAEFIRQFIIIIVSVIALAYYSLELTLTMLASLPVVIIIAIFLGRWVKRFSKNTQERVSESNVIAEETFTAIATVKAFANEVFEVFRYRAKTEEIRQIAMKNAVARGLLSSFIIAALFGAIVLVVWRAAKLLEAGEMLPGELLSFLIYTVFVGASIGGTADLFARLQKAVGATEDLFDILDETVETIPLTGEDQTSERTEGKVTFSDVTFAYPNRSDIQVLKGVSLEAQPGETLAVVGQSGAGKSTLVSLILRFYDPQDGAIRLDGTDIREIPLSELRQQMAIVPQEVLLFGGTIRENIAYGKPGASEEEIKDAAEKAYALSFIESFPDGFETIVGERGIQLSGGQRQRIAIARALLKDPCILILDEATSSLDSESERQVQAALETLMKGRTSIVIAHRLSTIRQADRIVVLEDGRIVETGTHDQLMEQEQGVYRGLSELQWAGQ